MKDNRPVYKVASEASYWFSRLKTMDIVTVHNVHIEFGNEGCGRYGAVYRRDGPLVREGACGCRLSLSNPIGHLQPLPYKAWIRSRSFRSKVMV